MAVESELRDAHARERFLGQESGGEGEVGEGDGEEEEEQWEALVDEEVEAEQRRCVRALACTLTLGASLQTGPLRHQGHAHNSDGKLNSRARHCMSITQR